jgi:sarcosine oxidase
MDTSFDVIVIGLGAFGAATTYQLAKAGARVLGLDRYSPPHGYGSTHGETRITRLACGEGAEYTAFARRSHAIWRDLERATGDTLLVQNGLLVISGAGKRAPAHGKTDFLGGTFAAARENAVAHERLDDAAIRARFPAFAVADGDVGYFEPEAGYCFPERCVAAELAAARRLGATLKTGETVASFTDDAHGVRVVTDRGAYAAERLVVAAGPWLPQLVPALAPLLTVRRQVLVWFRVAADAPIEHFRPDRFPVFYWQVPREQAIYGFPSIDGATLKIATEQYRTTTTPETVDRHATPEEIADIHRDYVAPFFPGVSDACTRSAVCLYTCTEDTRFIVDTLPGHDNVVVASPCSGHGFKHSAAIGEAIAARVLGHGGVLGLEPFGLPRHTRAAKENDHSNGARSSGVA